MAVRRPVGVVAAVRRPVGVAVVSVAPAATVELRCRRTASIGKGRRTGHRVGMRSRRRDRALLLGHDRVRAGDLGRRILRRAYASVAAVDRGAVVEIAAVLGGVRAAAVAGAVARAIAVAIAGAAASIGAVWALQIVVQNVDVGVAADRMHRRVEIVVHVAAVNVNVVFGVRVGLHGAGVVVVVVVIAIAFSIAVVFSFVFFALLVPQFVGKVKAEFHRIEGVLEGQTGKLLTELERLGSPSFLRHRDLRVVIALGSGRRLGFEDASSSSSTIEDLLLAFFFFLCDPIALLRFFG